MHSKDTAHSATAAAKLLKRLGKLPFYSYNKKKPGKKELETRKKAAKQAANELIKSPSQNLQALKGKISSEHKILFLKNSEILQHIPKSRNKLRNRLIKAPTRTLSGVSPIAIMFSPFPCGGGCIYCPKGGNAPQSYTGYEPTTMRAIQNQYSAKKQIASRLKQYQQQGHETSKCHLIIMGGTFLCAPPAYRRSFIKQAFDELNGFSSKTLKQAIDSNEKAPHRAIGVTYETRPDYAFEKHANEFLLLAGTQVELGVQCLSNKVYKKVNRGHTIADVIKSTQILKNSGFKVCYHMMPGLFCTPRQDIAYFKKLFSSQDFQPDMLKIYPTLVVQGSEIYNLWKKGKYSPYTTEQAAKVIAQATKYIPSYVRVQRIQRDIPVPIIAAGVKHSNLRQIVEQKLAKRGEHCRCIRCREIGAIHRKKASPGKLNLKLQRLDYKASKAKEIFLSFEDMQQDILAAFLRLRIPKNSHRKEIGSFSSIVRELHVYGQEAAIGEHSPRKLQHTGFGKKLLSEAEAITKKEFGLSKIFILSGPGARGYYRKFNYSLDGPYMSKKL